MPWRCRVRCRRDGRTCADGCEDKYEEAERAQAPQLRLPQLPRQGHCRDGRQAQRQGQAHRRRRARHEHQQHQQP